MFPVDFKSSVLETRKNGMDISLDVRRLASQSGRNLEVNSLVLGLVPRAIVKGCIGGLFNYVKIKMGLLNVV